MDPRNPFVAAGTPLESQPAYATLMGELQHLVNGTRPDVARHVLAFSSYTKSPTELHWYASGPLPLWHLELWYHLWY